MCACVWVGGMGGRVGRDYECKGMLFVFPHYHCFQSLQVFLFLRHLDVIWVLRMSSFFIYLRAPSCPILFGVMFSSTCSHLSLSFLLGHFPFSYIFNTFFGMLIPFSLNINVTNHKGINDMSVVEHCLAPKYVQPMDLLSDVIEKSTRKTGFYIPWVHIFLNSVHIFISPAWSSIRRMLYIPWIKIFFLFFSLIVCSRAEHKWACLCHWSNLNLKNQEGKLIFGYNFLSTWLPVCTHTNFEPWWLLDDLWHLCYTGCNRRNGPDFGRVFLTLNYTEKPQNTYIQSGTVWEIMAIENCGLPSGPRTIAVSWHSYLLVGLLAELQQAAVLRHHSTLKYDV